MKYWNTMTSFTNQEKHYLNYYFLIIIIIIFKLDNINKYFKLR